MDFGILGSLTVVVHGVEVPIVGAKVRSLLALLVVRPRETITVERLADELWGDRLPNGYVNGLQSLVSRLRRALGAGGSAVVTTSNGYMLDVEPSAVDAHRFAAAAQLGRRALADADPAAAADTLRDALALWRGPALDGLIDDGVLRAEATRLEETRLDALEDRIDADLRLGRHGEVIAELAQLTAAHPLRERFHGFEMLALYRAGRQADALRSFQQVRAVLAEQLGLEPGPELRALEAAILDHDPALDLPAPPSAADESALRSNLWRELSTFVGRDADVVELGALVDIARLVTVIGPGGAGKTRLAVEVSAARMDREDVWFVDLAPLRDGEQVAETVATVIGLAGSAPVSPTQVRTTMVAAIAAHVGSRPMLVLLDNCEHVVPHAAALAQQLLVNCPGLRIVATSREALGVRGETVWPVPPMSTSDAVQLFADRAGSASGFVLDAEIEPTVAELCTRLDGLPLAIELAAGRVRALPVHQLAARLDDRFRLLTGGARTAMPRQQTLRAVVEWSYELLFDDEQRVFERLSVFAGGCTLEAAEIVCAGDDVAVEDIADLLAHLVDKSLLIADHSGPDVRFRLLQTLGLFGRERLVASGDADEVRGRHAALYASLCRRGYRAIRGDEDQQAWLTEMHRDFDNVRAAIDWLLDRGAAAEAQTLLGGIAWRWWFGAQGDQGMALLSQSIESTGPTTPYALGVATMWAGYVGACAGMGMEEGAARIEVAAQLLTDAPDEQFVEMDRVSLLGQAQGLLADISMMRGDPRAARRHLRLAIDLLSTGGDGWMLGGAHQRSAQLAELDGDIDGAYAHLVESSRHFEAAHVDYGVAVVSGDAGMMAMRLERYDDALVYSTRAREAAGALRMRGMECLFITHLASMATRSGDLEASDRLSTEAIKLAQRNGIAIMQAHGQASRAVVRFLAGRFEEAGVAAQLAIDGFAAAGWLRSRTQPHAILGAVAVERGDLAAARRHYADAQASAQRVRHRRSIALVLEGLAAVAVAEGDAERAAVLLGVAESVRAQQGGGRPSLASSAPTARTAAITVLGADAFEAAVARGRALDPARVDEMVLAEIGDVDAAADEDVAHQGVGGELLQVFAPER